MMRRTLDILEAATDRKRSVKELSDLLSLKIGSTWHHVRKLVEAGILVEAGKRDRKGRAQKLYQASATRFIVATDLRRTSITRQLSKIMDESLAYGDQAVGELFYFDGSRWRVDDIYEDEAGSDEKQHDRWLIARLDSSQREKLEKEVAELFDKYSRAQRGGGARSIIRFACVTLPPEYS